jgi:hypothetical protein
MKIAQQIPIGTPINAAPRVTDTVPATMGSIPYSPRLGAHVLPKTLGNIGTPSLKINSVITASAVIEVSANRKNILPDRFSLNFFINSHLR